MRAIKTNQPNTLLPINKTDMQKRGWDQLDFLLITGDAYVDHPSFANGLIARHIENLGYKIGVIAQPDWKTTHDFTVMGSPKLGVLISAGNLDSMLNKLTAARNKRPTDDYSPGGQTGKRPDRATLVYCNIAKQLWKDTAIIIGGIEPSLRKFAHYDYWSDQVRRPILADCRADLLVYGMGELQLQEIAHLLHKGVPITSITNIKGTCYIAKHPPEDAIIMPSYEQVLADKKAYARAFKLSYDQQDPFRGKTLAQACGDKTIICNPPMRPLTTQEFDRVQELPYTRNYHPIYQKDGGIPALKEIKFSIASNRGCFGSCAFCAIHEHQGRIVYGRSQESIIKEAKTISQLPDFKGYIHDIGGPTANFLEPACEKQLTQGSCPHRQCLFPTPCPNLKASHKKYLQILKSVRQLPNIKKVFIRSGIRHDYVLADKNGKEFIDQLCQHHVSGQLRLAPEHASPKVLKLMGKPSIDQYLAFKKQFDESNKKHKKEQYILPYLISSHPGSTLNDAIYLAEFLRDQKIQVDQVQDFIPTPGSLATCAFYTGIDVRTDKEIHIPRGGNEKKMQRALLQYRKPENQDLAEEALRKANRQDLIGFNEKCLIRPKPKTTQPPKNHKKRR